METGSFSFTSCPHVLVLKKLRAQIKTCKLAQHLHKALRRGLVKAIQRA